MRIAVDLSRALNESAGIARYTRTVIREMLRQRDPEQFRFFATYLRGDEEKRLIARAVVGDALVPVHRIPGALKEWLWGTPLSLPDRWCPDADRLFAPTFFEAPVGTKLPTVVTIHDMTTFLFPKQRGVALSERHNARVRAVVARAAHICAISGQTKQDLVEHCQVDPAKITVTPLAADPLFTPSDRVREPVILTVGTLEPRKNLARVIQAYAQLPRTMTKEYRLVLVGKLGWNYQDIFAALPDSTLREQITFTGRISDEELRDWYQRASLFVYPSLYEGFGIPPLEAMACGTPVVTANVSSLPEVVGDAALTVDPERVEAIRDAMARVLTDSGLAQTLTSTGLARSRQFSWEKTALTTLRILEAL